MTRVIDLTGQQFGRLTVRRRAERTTKAKKAHWYCECECGGATITTGDNLRRGHTTSCGCAVIDALTQRVTTHGLSDNAAGKGHELYGVWQSMRGRCLTPTNAAYARYGGRGITIAPVWDDFERFVADVGPRPSPRHSLDRIDNDGNYEPGNVRWATAKEQANNRRRRDQPSYRQLADALDAVLALHQPTPDDDDHGGHQWCTACGEDVCDGNYPCPTVAAITDALGGAL